MTWVRALYAKSGPNQKHVMFCPVSRLYVGMDCVSRTPLRDYAWVGTLAQSYRAREVYDVEPNFITYPDGEERPATSSTWDEQSALSSRGGSSAAAPIWSGRAQTVADGE